MTLQSFTLLELIGFIVLIVTLTIGGFNFVGYLLMRMTENYKKTTNIFDDHLHKFSRVFIKGTEKFAKMFFARY